MRLSPTIVRTASHSAHPAPVASGSSKTAFLVSPPMSGIPSKQRDSGYTLVEVLVAMTVVAILAAIAIPSFKYVTTSNRITTEVNTLLGDIQFARAEAIKEGQSVTVCEANNTYLACGGSNHWENGWIVFMDLNGDGTWQAGETILRTQKAFTGGDTFVADQALTTGVTFNRLGYGNTHAATPPTTIVLHSSPAKPVWTRCLAISAVGQTTTQKAVPAVAGQNCT
jgi:type IV fimbrial biogenesis protein FimT